MPASTFRAWFIGTIFVVAGYVDSYRVLRTGKRFAALAYIY